MSCMYDWNAPATLVYWPGQDNLAEEACPTLREAIREADGGAGQTPWIVIQNGEILHPQEIAALKLEAALKPEGARQATNRRKLGFLRPSRHPRPVPRHEAWTKEIGLGE